MKKSKVRRKIYLTKYTFQEIRGKNDKCEFCGNDAEQVHHMNFDRNDHSFSNLKILCTRCHRLLHHRTFTSHTSKNLKHQNNGNYKGGLFGFDGSYYRKDNQQWRSVIRYKYKNKSLGQFTDPVSASIVTNFVRGEIYE